MRLRGPIEGAQDADQELFAQAGWSGGDEGVDRGHAVGSPLPRRPAAVMSPVNRSAVRVRGSSAAMAVASGDATITQNASPHR